MWRGCWLTDYTALAHGLNGIATELSVGATDSYVHCVERNSISLSPLTGLVTRCFGPAAGRNTLHSGVGPGISYWHRFVDVFHYWMPRFKRGIQ
jgi:hypothetical protein